MTDHPNPYQPPPELPTVPLEVEAEVERLEFISDWSASGIRARRKRSWHQTFDYAFGGLTIFLLCVLILGCSGLFRGTGTIPMIARLLGGAACWLAPVWAIAFVYGLRLWAHRQADSFPSYLRGLNGRVFGWLDGPWFHFFGPSVCLMTHQRACRSVSKNGECVVVRPPGITETLPLFTHDVLERRMTSVLPTRFPETAEQWIDYALDALRSLPARFHDEESCQIEADQTICGSGSLSGRHYRRTPRNRTYIAIASLLATFGLITAGAAIYQYRALPVWVVNQPAHYSLSDDERTQFFTMYLTAGIAIFLFGCSLQQWWQTVRGYGTFAVAIGEKGVLLAGSKSCHGFYRRSLRQFVWIPQGLAVTDGSGTAPVFLIPTTWFDEAAQSKIAEWYPLPPAGLRDFGGTSDFIQPKP